MCLLLLTAQLAIKNFIKIRPGNFKGRQYEKPRRIQQDNIKINLENNTRAMGINLADA
jgi:hypothetical protein